MIDIFGHDELFKRLFCCHFDNFDLFSPRAFLSLGSLSLAAASMRRHIFQLPVIFRCSRLASSTAAYIRRFSLFSRANMPYR